MNNTTPLRILIADDHPVVREGLVALISRSPDMTIVAEASNGREAVEQFFLRAPDVALLDLRMPEMDGVDAITAIRQLQPAARLILLTTFDDDEDIFRGFCAGAKAFLLKDAPRNELLECLRTVHSGQTIISPVVAAKLACRLCTLALTPREFEVLHLIAEGNGNKEIAATLFIAEGAVKTHVNAVLRKLDAMDRTQAVTAALKRGILHLE
ncbi:MAG: response regulator transcription factor [Bacillota bacterium]|jgi:two-component system NarL family response regulator